MRSSSGCSEVIHTGRKSQFCSLCGKQPGLCTWSMFTAAHDIMTIMTGTPIPVITFHPAMERANTRDGNSKKQRRRYKMANQRYLCMWVINTIFWFPLKLHLTSLDILLAIVCFYNSTWQCSDQGHRPYVWVSGWLVWDTTAKYQGG